MLKVIAQKIQTHSRYYQIIFDNTSLSDFCRLPLAIQILQENELNDFKDGVFSKCSSDWLNVL